MRVKLYLVISPNGSIAKATTDPAVAGFYRPQEDADGVPLFEGYELFAVDAETPWIADREVIRELRARLTDPVKVPDPIYPVDLIDPDGTILGE